MEFGVLGPLVVTEPDGDAVRLGSPSQGVILAALVANSPRVVSTDALIHAIWGDDPPASAQSSLRAYISRLRRLVGDRIDRQGSGYVLTLSDGDTIDSAEFEALLSIATGQTGTSVQAFEDALGLWRGDAFADHTDLDLVIAEARRLDEVRQSAHEGHARALLKAGDAGAAIAAAEAHLARHALREGGWAVLIDALAADGRSAEALRGFQRAADALAEAGLEPSPMLRAAEERVFNQEAEVGATPIPSGNASTPIRPATSIVGREEDLLQVMALMETARIVTLHGPGGVGKTRLARELSAIRHERHRLGAVFVPMARLSNGEAARLAIADALELSMGDGTVTEALARAGELDVLLVLDNCEHVVDAISEAIEAIVGGGTAARILTTSRERVGVPGEHSWSLAPLDVGATDSSAVELFVERARSHHGSLVVHDEDRRVIQALCRDVDGLPLAIEMAAARTASMSFSELAQVLRERLDILRSTERRGDSRHRTLGDVIDWSEALLTADERDVFHEMSVFAGPVAVADVESVLDRDRVVDTLCDLADRSLVVADSSTTTTTYRLLGTVRRHGRLKLEEQGQSEAMSLRHLDHYIDRARAADSALRTPHEAEADSALDAMFDEFRAAHLFARSAAPAAATSLSAALHLYAVSRTRDEAQQWAVAAAEVGGTSVEDALTLATVAFRANNQGRFDEARQAAERVLEIAAGDPVRRFGHEVLSDAALYNGDLDTGYEHGRYMVEAGLEASDPYSVCMGRGSMALALRYGGRVEEALAALDEPAPSVSSPSNQGWLLYTRGEVLLDVEPDVALDLFTQVIKMADSVGERFLAGVARVSVVSLLGRHGEPADALASFASIIDHWYRRGHETHQLTTLRNLVVLLDRLDEPRLVAELVGSVSEAGGAQTFGEEAARLGAASEHAERALGAEYEQRFADGARRSLAEAGLHAIEVVNSLRESASIEADT